MLNEQLSVRPLHESDLEAVLAIERASYQQPWTLEQFKQELKNPVSLIAGCQIENRLAGYICYWLVAGEMQILNLATAPRYRRRGVAKKLLDYAFAFCEARGLVAAWLEVRAGNLAAQDLYRQCGFEVDGCRRAYYQDGEDALLMVRKFASETFQESGE